MGVAGPGVAGAKQDPEQPKAKWVRHSQMGGSQNSKRNGRTHLGPRHGLVTHGAARRGIHMRSTVVLPDPYKQNRPRSREQKSTQTTNTEPWPPINSYT